MDSDTKTRVLSIFLIKSTNTVVSDIIEVSQCNAPISITVTGLGTGQLFVKRTPPRPPKWASLFSEYLEPSSLAVPGVSGAFLVQVADRSFVLAFGQGGRFLLKSEVYEERFGLICALNSVSPKSLRCMDVQSLDAIQSHSRIQSGQETTSDQFGLDVEQDMLKAIVGTPSDPALGSRMTGSDALTVAVKADLDDLPVLLGEYRKKFETELSAETHQWVNNISLVKNSDTLEVLEAKLNAKLGKKSFDNIWLSIPDIIDWHNVEGFTFSYGKKAIHSDITLEHFLKTLDEDEPLTLELMHQRKVSCADADRNLLKSWPVYRCLYAELDVEDRKYILNDGKWFAVALDFVARTNSDFSKIPLSELKLPAYKGGDESEYNAAVAASAPNIYALLDDTQKVMHGGGHGQVEICDLLHIDRHLIHVKRYAKSSVLSHLFAQGFVSGQLIQIDADFRKKVHEKLSPPFAHLVQADKKPGQDEFTITYGIISNDQTPGLTLPFFSRVNLNNTAKILRGFGYKVELLKIPVDAEYAAVTKYPAKKHKS